MSLLNYFPLSDPQQDNDVLGFEAEAKHIAEFINNHTPLYPFAIAINGPWGSGKSTMANFVMNNLNMSCEAIPFNPWLVSDKETLISSLFEEIFIRLRRKDENTNGVSKELSHQFLAYTKKVLPTTVKALTYATSLYLGIEERNANFISGVMGDFSKEIKEEYENMPLSELKKNLETEMKKEYVDRNKKIVVFIDEIDRLLHDEIVTVLKMIRSTLNLPGLFFVISMDYNAVIEALKESGIKEPNYYLEKIFQFNYHINTKNQIRTLVQKIMYPIFESRSEEAYKDLKVAIEAYFLRNKDYHLISIDNFENFTNDFGLSTVDYMLYQLNGYEKGNAAESHSEICNIIIEDLNIEVPRNFINLTNYILEFWPRFYMELFKNVEKCNFNIKPAFLLFLLKYKYPKYCETTYIFENKGDNLPNFVQEIRGHINYYIPKFVKYNVSPREERMDDSFLRLAVGLLNKSPDQIEELGLLAERKRVLLEKQSNVMKEFLAIMDKERNKEEA